MNLSFWIPLVITLLHVVGIATALHALYHSRSSQGSIAWILSLVMFPILTIPAYFIFGRTRFGGYREKIGAMIATRRAVYTEYREKLAEHRVEIQSGHSPDPLERIAGSDLLSGNKLELLINGAATFEAVFRAIDKASRYILVEFFIIKDDEVGRDLRERLMRKAREGVSVYVLYDEVGSNKLSSAYLDPLKEAGVKVSSFHTRQ